jgi:hypothetical protein
MATAVGTGFIYVPIAPANVVPQLAGSTGTGGLENLVKRSANGIPFSSGANASSRAANISTTTSAQNGPSISLARWNRPLLLLKNNINQSADLTPVPTFTAPDWIFVAQDGSNPTTWNSSLSASGTNPVSGRYAYTIYDEGGTLDMNFAGYSSTTSLQQIAYKTSLGYADLTQVGLTQAQVDAMSSDN